MPNILKQIQDLGGICWDRYITGFGQDSLYINSYIDGCDVKQINFNSQVGSIETGITGDFKRIKLFTDQNNSYYGQKIKNLENEFSINLNVSNNFGNLKIGDILNTGNGIFNEINLITNKNKSAVNIIDTNKNKIFIDTIDFPEGKLAKFRCIKLNPDETEQTCIKILSTKEIVLKCCGEGSMGIGGANGNEGSLGIGGETLKGIGGGDGIVGLEGPIGLAGTANIGIDGKAGIEGLIYAGESPQGIQGQTLDGQVGSIGQEGLGLAGDNGSNGPSVNVNGQKGIDGFDGAIIAPNLSSPGEGGLKGLDGKIGQVGPPNTNFNVNDYKGLQGFAGPVQSSNNASQGLEGQIGSSPQGPFTPLRGDGGLNGQGGLSQSTTINPGLEGSKGSPSISPGGKGENGLGGLLTPISTFINVGALRAAIVGDIQYVIYGITGFLNPFNKNDTTNNPVFGTQPGSNQIP